MTKTKATAPTEDPVEGVPPTTTPDDFEPTPPDAPQDGEPVPEDPPRSALDDPNHPLHHLRNA